MDAKRSVNYWVRNLGSLKTRVQMRLDRMSQSDYDRVMPAMAAINKLESMMSSGGEQIKLIDKANQSKDALQVISASISSTAWTLSAKEAYRSIGRKFPPKSKTNQGK